MKPQLMFAPLETPQSRWKVFLTSGIIQAHIVIAIVVLNILFPHQIQQAKKFVYTSLVAPVEPMIREAQPVNPRLQVRTKIAPVMETPMVAKLVVPRQVRAVREPEPDVAAPDVKVATPMLNLPKMPDAPLAKVIATNTFKTSTNVMPTTAKSAAQVQTGGFGDPNGIPATGDGKHGVNISARGNPGLPAGAGFGNGLGGTKGVAGVGIVGNGIQSSGFDKQYSAAPKQVLVASAESGSPVEIIAKPKPSYTEEGRKRGVEGEVRLEVQFSADSHVHVVRILQGLGFGLDEQAVRAAEQIKFRPAMHGGQAIDSTAVVRIVFELAS